MSLRRRTTNSSNNFRTMLTRNLLSGMKSIDNQIILQSISITMHTTSTTPVPIGEIRFIS